jgi:hypothetical protein
MADVTEVVALATNGCGYEKGKNTKFKNRKRFFTFLYPLLSDVILSLSCGGMHIK